MSLVQAEIRRPSVLKKSTPFELMGPNVSKAIGMKVCVSVCEQTTGILIPFLFIIIIIIVHVRHSLSPCVFMQNNLLIPCVR